ncbi:hypothetical protein M885DRAFT_504237 [Pelagophyceae sp. CCMP2097]|nr:hypothetical protein M885DRAFT_504237 [Pelagophyceae sp. CCMP2097]|mmetsp:Transcript_2208/g.7892  ORF Transcript_2208/g.7892 Transcript_2208/m.7892 type:complete len:419 (+) Transcript_2208:106-1362(+)
MVSLFSGEVQRTWRFVDGAGADHEVSLLHDPLTGARAALVDHDELPGSAGTTSVFHAANTTLPFRAGSAQGRIVIARDRWGFAYACVADGQVLREATSGDRADAAPPPRLSARVVSACVTRDHAAANAITWYLVETRLGPESDESNPFGLSSGPTTRVHRRFRDFADLDGAVFAALAGHHMRSSVPRLPSRQFKMVTDHNDAAFVERRRGQLDDYLRRLVSVPHVLALPASLPFVGVTDHVREFSVVFQGRTLGFTVAKCAARQPPPGIYAPTAPDFPAYVAHLDADAPDADGAGAIAAGDVLSKISGLSTAGMPFRSVIAAIQHSQRPLMLHFLAARQRPRAAIGERAAAQSAGREQSAAAAPPVDAFDGRFADERKGGFDNEFADVPMPPQAHEPLLPPPRPRWRDDGDDGFGDRL